MPQGSDLSKSIRTMKKDIDRARRGVPDEEYIVPVAPPFADKGVGISRIDLTNPKPVAKPGGSFIKPQPSQISAQGIQMQKLAEEKQRVEKLRIEEQQKKEAIEKARLLGEEREKKMEEQKKEEERRKIIEEEKRKKEEEDRKRQDEEEKKRKESEEKNKREKLKEMFLSEDLSAKKKAISDERIKLDQAKSGINSQLKAVANLKKPLEAEKNSYLKKINLLKDSYAQLSRKEAEAESEKETIEEKETASSNDEEKRKLEQERWKVEEKRRDVEKKRWTIEENINLLEAKIQEFDLKYWPIKEKEDNFENQLADFGKNEENLKAKIREVILKEDLRKAEETKRLVERKITQLEDKAEELGKKLEAALKNEKYIEDEEKLTEEKEKTAADIKQRKEAEEKRWLIEKQRRDVERNRWGLEAEKKTVEFDLASAHKIADNVSLKSGSIFGELLKLQPLIIEEPRYEKKEAPVKKIIAEEIKTEVKKETPEKPAAKEIKAEVIKEMPETEKSKIDSLKEEIILPEPKPMRQNGTINRQETEDDKKLVEEARKKIDQLEKQEIIEEDAGVQITSPIKSQPKPRDWASIQSQLNPQPQIKQQVPYAPPAATFSKPMQSGAPLSPKQLEPKASPLTSNILASHPLPKRSGLGKKIFARTLSVFLVAALLFLNVTFWYWYIFVRPKNMPPAVVATSPTPTPECLADKDCSSGKICSQDGKCGDKPIIIVGPIFPITETKEYKISNYSDIPGIMLNVISEWPNDQDFAVDKFRRIVIIDQNERRQVTVKEIFDALLITAPSGFFERLGENYTLFEYAQKEGIRVGLVSSIIDKETFVKLMSQNEGTMKDDYRSFFSLMNLESPLTAKVFASASKVKGYTGVDFRYLPVSKNDLGICYSIYNDYFLISTSFESAKKALESLKNQLAASPSPSASPSATPK